MEGHHFTLPVKTIILKLSKYLLFKHANITTKDRIIFKDEEYEIYAKQDLGARERFLLIWGRKIEPTN